MVENLAVGAVATFAQSESAHTICFDWIIVLDSATDIEIVNALLANLITARPDKVVPIVYLKLHVGMSGFVLAIPNAASIPINALQNYVTDHPVVDTFYSFRVTTPRYLYQGE